MMPILEFPQQLVENTAFYGQYVPRVWKESGEGWSTNPSGQPQTSHITPVFCFFAMLWHCSQNNRHLKKREVQFFEMFGTDYPVTLCHTS